MQGELRRLCVHYFELSHTWITNSRNQSVEKITNSPTANAYIYTCLYIYRVSDITCIKTYMQVELTQVEEKVLYYFTNNQSLLRLEYISIKTLMINAPEYQAFIEKREGI